MAAHRKHPRLSDERCAALVEEMRLGRYYRTKAIAARYGIPVASLWKIERELRERAAGGTDNPMISQRSKP